ncbi:hypothetical protein D3C72_2394750 [compost metagenome]
MFLGVSDRDTIPHSLMYCEYCISLNVFARLNISAVGLNSLYSSMVVLIRSRGTIFSNGSFKRPDDVNFIVGESKYLGVMLLL